MVRCCTIAVFLVLLIPAVPIFGWDEAGHKITAYIAWQTMTPQAREKAISLLLAAPEDSDIATFYLPYGSQSAEARKREYFMLMATWADIVRDKAFPVRFKKYHNSNWHCSDKLWELKDGKVIPVSSLDESGHALEKLSEFAAVITGNAPDADKAVAVAWIEHLVGDIHQPLHNSARVYDTNRKGDMGGNLFLLTPAGTPKEKQENLHWFWDSIIVRYKPNDKDLCDVDYIEPIAKDIMNDHPFDKEKEHLHSGKFAVWSNESYEIATSQVYKDVNFYDPPSDKYKKMAYETSRRRLALAGYRMADIFNEAFSKPAVN